MSYDAQGKIYIPLEEFWEFVAKYLPESSAEVRYGVPQVTEVDIEVEYAASTMCDPDDWAGGSPFKAQWVAALQKRRQEETK